MNRSFPPPVPQDEGGLRAPPGLSFWGEAWWWFDFVILVKLARLRFIAVLAVIGVVITQWDWLAAYYDKWTRPAGSAAAHSDVEWYCPMHPSVVRDNGSEKCPVCFMPLSKRKKGEQHDEALPAGVVSRVQLSPYRVVLAGVRTWPVQYVKLHKELRTIGYVEFNERGLRTVSARVKGRLDRLQINETGQMVDQGDELGSIYSPELVVTVQNLLDAQKRNNAILLKSARQRLELLGIEDDQIERLLESGQPDVHVRIRSPIGGHVIRKYVREGQYVEEGAPLYEVADLATVWVQSQVYEDDLAFLPSDQIHGQLTDAQTLPVTAVTRAFPDETFSGRLTFIYPHVDQATRTVSMRFEMENPGHKLRPGTTMTVRIEIPAERMPFLARSSNAEFKDRLNTGEVLAVPEASVIHTGGQQIVYREASPNTFEGTQVTLGPRMTDVHGVVYYAVLDGLAEGDLISTAGSFLIDAETRLNPAAGSIYFGSRGGSDDSSAGHESHVTTVRPTTPEDPDAKITAALAKLSTEDRAAAEKQQFCVVLKKSRLGSMGVPVRVTHQGRSTFICCPACKDQALRWLEKEGNSQPEQKTDKSPTETKDPTLGDRKEGRIQAALAKLSTEDRTLAERQKFCPVMPESRLGSMGPPVKVRIGQQTVFLCCEGCREDALANSQDILRKLKENGAGTSEKAAKPSRDSR